ncbi:hypothetical protein HNR42_000459 [Deinobacterium chartae]|uniref:DinB-like domain-containing protein n=1 Tax=Deinobacterium chartae TaxID=521158 RepID=A0A841HZ83_9DEIO|nr:DinB family protein [Deinobacterium chartae]MBB6097045.1 hypothetical protein [Deinobacterium chartae]
MDTRFLARFGRTPADALARLEAELDAFEAQARRLEAQGRWTQAPASGGWSPAQIAEHVLKVNVGCSKAVHLLRSGRDLPPLPRVPGSYQDGRRQSPPAMLPGDGQPWASLEAAWQQARTRLHAAVQAEGPWPDDRCIFHPFLEDLNALQWLQMAAYHTAHHRGQLPAD